jgi:hypothetical protein
MNNGKCKEYRIEEGIAYVVETLAISFLYSYENYLISKLEDESIILRERAELEECLQKYYRFLLLVNVEPYVRKVIDDGTEVEIFGNEELPEKYLKRYERMTITGRELNETRKTIIEVFKRNSMKNITELNKTIHQLIKGDMDFQHSLLQMAK